MANVSDRFPPVTILTSGVGLGIYVPSLLVQRQLGDLGVKAEVEVFEEYYSTVNQASFLAHKEAFQKNFSLALMANRMARPAQHFIDHIKMAELMERWTFENRNHFILWSGYWLPVLERYKSTDSSRPLYIDLCRIDAEVSASFRANPTEDLGGTEIWLWNWVQRKIVRELPITTARTTPIPFGERENRVIVHGGGWGLGTFRNVLPEVESTKYALDVVLRNTGEIRRRRAGDRNFIIDPDWQPWQRGLDGQHLFPAVGTVLDEMHIEYRTREDFHEIYNVISRCKAIISKPGGGTLIDSLNSATPVVFLEPFGRAEAKNAALWEYLGFGVSYREWQISDYSELMLAKLHSNIIRRRIGYAYPRDFVKRLESNRRGNDEAI